MQSEASADAATDSAASSGNAALSQAAGTASAPPELPTANGHLPTANGLTPAAQKAIPKGQVIATPPGSAPLKGVPALPECRVRLVTEVHEAAASQIRQAEGQHPTKAEAEYRDAEGMYSPEQPFWGVLSDARALSSADSDRQVRHWRWQHVMQLKSTLCNFYVCIFAEYAMYPLSVLLQLHGQYSAFKVYMTVGLLTLLSTEFKLPYRLLYLFIRPRLMRHRTPPRPPPLSYLTHLLLCHGPFSHPL